MSAGPVASKGPPWMRHGSGNALLDRLKKEGACVDTEKGLITMSHIIQHRTPGCITAMRWYRERTLLKHEYLVLSVLLPRTLLSKSEGLSWIRVERRRPENENEQGPADFYVTLAADFESRINTEDKCRCRVDFAVGKGPTLVDFAHFVQIAHDVAPEYHLWYENCWWLARSLFQFLASEFLPDGPEKERVSSICDKRADAHAKVLYQSTWRGRGARELLLLLTLPVSPVTWPTILVATKFIAEIGINVLSTKERCLAILISKYMEKRKKVQAKRFTIRPVEWPLRRSAMASVSRE